MIELDNEYVEIIDSLYTASLSGELIWSRKDISNELLILSTKGMDKTIFEMFFLWSFRNDWELSNYIKITNDKMEFYIHPSKAKRILDLRDLLQSKYCPDFIKTDKDTLNIITSIKQGISKSILRDNKLTKILTK